MNEKELKVFEELLNESMNKIYDFGGMGIFADVKEDKIVFYNDDELLTYYKKTDEEYQIEIWENEQYLDTIFM